MENTLVQKKNPWLLIISIGAFVKAFITLVIGLLMIVLGDPKITNIIFIVYNMLYIVAGDIFVGLATLAFHKQKDSAKKYLKIASMIYFIGFNVVVILLLLSIVIYLIKLVLSISGSQIGQFFASLGILIFALVIFVIIVLAMYTFFGSIHRFSKDEENKNGVKTIAISSIVLGGVLLVFEVISFIVNLSNTSLLSSFIDIFSGNLLSTSICTDISGILLLIGTIMTSLIMILSGVGLLLRKENK